MEKTHVDKIYYDANGNVAGTFAQSLLGNSYTAFDNTNAEVLDVVIGEHNGILIRYSPTEFAFVWMDGQYRYKLLSYTMTYEDGLKIAESLSAAK